MRPRNRVPTHPGEVLLEEFLKPLGITQVQLAASLGVPVQRVNEIIKEKRGVSPETAWFLAEAFGTTPEFWLNLQRDYDLATKKPARRIERLRTSRQENQAGPAFLLKKAKSRKAR